jgi:TDG/mug DNA glycosylase family protein
MILEDVLAPGLRLVFCGSAAGQRSAQLRQYYAGRGNKFWRTLAEVSLTPRRLTPAEYALLPCFGIGLTDLVQDQSGGDADLDFARAGRAELREKILLHEPRLLCFNGKRAAQEFLGRKRVAYGLQRERIGRTRLFVAPSTSGAASGAWDAAQWRKLARLAGHGRARRARAAPGRSTRYSRRDRRS